MGGWTVAPARVASFSVLVCAAASLKRDRVERARDGRGRVGGDARRWACAARRRRRARRAGSAGSAPAISAARSCGGREVGAAAGELGGGGGHARRRRSRCRRPRRRRRRAPAVSALPGAASSGLGSPPADGPWRWRAMPRLRGGVGGRPAARRAPRRDGRRPACELEQRVRAPSPVTPTTGAAARPAASAGSGRSRGSASSTSAAPRVGGRGGLGAGVGAGADDHRLAAQLPRPACRARPGRPC